MKDLFWGGLIISIGLVSGSSVFLGDMDWWNILFDGLGVFWICKGGISLARRGKQAEAASAGGPGNPAIRNAAKRILAELKLNYQTLAALRPAKAAQFAHLDWRRYDACQAAMERRGFRCLGDYENTVVNESPGSLIAPTVLRVYSAEDGSVVAAYYQIKPRMARRIKTLLLGLLALRWIAAPRDFAANLEMRQCVDADTEFDDGTFVMTSNNPQAGLITAPASVIHAFHPFGTSLATLLDAHRATVAKLMHEGRRVVPIRTGDEMLNMQKRLAALKLAHRENVQWVTKEELRAMSPGNAALADAIHGEVQRLVAAERTG